MGGSDVLVRPDSTWSPEDAEHAGDTLHLPKGRLRIGPPAQRRPVVIDGGSVLIAPDAALGADDLDALAGILKLPRPGRGRGHEKHTPPPDGHT